jgi:hypothetical protein
LLFIVADNRIKNITMLRDRRFFDRVRARLPCLAGFLPRHLQRALWSICFASPAHLDSFITFTTDCLLYDTLNPEGDPGGDSTSPTTGYGQYVTFKAFYRVKQAMERRHPNGGALQNIKEKLFTTTAPKQSLAIPEEFRVRTPPSDTFRVPSPQFFC